MTGTTILAVDLGKYKCVACTYDRADLLPKTWARR